MSSAGAAASSRPSPATYLIIFTLNTKVCRQPSLFFRQCDPPPPTHTHTERPTPANTPPPPPAPLLPAPPPPSKRGREWAAFCAFFQIGWPRSVQLTGCGKLEIKDFHLPTLPLARLHPLSPHRCRRRHCLSALLFPRTLPLESLSLSLLSLSG